MTEPYRPAEDTFFLEDVVRGSARGRVAADVGCSSGYMLGSLARLGLEAVGVDIDSGALEEARKRLEGVYGVVHLVHASMMPFRMSSFDLVMSNPPYLPADEEFHDPAVHGGLSGWEKAAEVVKAARRCLKTDGLLIILVSSLSDVGGFLSAVNSEGFAVVERFELNLFFERLYCFKLRLLG
ncbi:MAG: methyltransferase domain-containing protein [Candidatus Caldarchaeum sp.]|nr:methyltransferase domain-containing protein [Candidatus Caldarchaeum sp.]